MANEINTMRRYFEISNTIVIEHFGNRSFEEIRDFVYKKLMETFNDGMDSERKIHDRILARQRESSAFNEEMKFKAILQDIRDITYKNKQHANQTNEQQSPVQTDQEQL